MFIFHEGLPGSGKSYEAMVHNVLPELKKGRKVYAYINGLNHEKIALLLEMDLAEVESLLIQITSEQVPTIQDHVEDNSFVVIDELQNFFPAGRQKLSDGITKFITEHRHRGLDILAMGQTLADCHNLFKRRCERKLAFTKLTAIGRPNSYKWEVFNGHLRGEKVVFEKGNSGIRKYDEKYFGIYKSHVSSDTNAEVLIDKRALIFNTPLFKYALPAVFVASIYAVYWLYSSFFTPQTQEAQTQQAQTQQAQTQQAQTQQAQTQQAQTQQAQTQQAQTQHNAVDTTYYESKNDIETGSDIFDREASSLKVRFSGFISVGAHTKGYLELYEPNTYLLKARYDTDELLDLGWQVEFKRYGIKLTKNKLVIIARNWPFDIMGRVDSHTSETL